MITAPLARIDTGSTIVRAASVEVSGVRAHVRFGLSTGSEIGYRVSGKPDRINAIRVFVRDNTFYVQSNSRVGIVGGRGSSPYPNLDDSPIINISVPKKTPIECRYVSGNVEITDTEGPIVVDISGYKLDVGCVAGASVKVSGGSVAVLARVRGDAVFEVSERGSIRMKSGSLRTLTATTSGHGIVTVKGTAVLANLNVLSGGTIDVSDLKIEPLRK